jgi:hypothetical protein
VANSCEMPLLADACVADLMVTSPTVHPAGVTVGEIRAFFLDEHKHMALVVDGVRLIATVERDDLSPELRDDVPARTIGTLLGRLLSPGAPAETMLASMRAAERRRLAVTDEHGALVGLLCLKSTGHGFCSDADVTTRLL